MAFSDNVNASGEKNYFWDLQCLDIVASTNDIVRDAARKGAPEGMCVAALQQTGGYGRQSRVWSSPKGGLYVSFLVRPQLPLAQRSSLSLVASLTVRNTLNRVFRIEDMRIKWPNDVMCNGTKVAGINLELVGNDALVIGIGINVFHPCNAPVSSEKYKFGFVSELDQTGRFAGVDTKVAPDGLTEEQRLCIVDVLIALLKEFEADYLCWSMRGFEVFRDDYVKQMTSVGRDLVMEGVDGTLMAAGQGVGVDSEGRLLLRDMEGVVRPIVAGEIHIVNRAY